MQLVARAPRHDLQSGHVEEMSGRGGGSGAGREADLRLTACHATPLAWKHFWSSFAC